MRSPRPWLACALVVSPLSGARADPADPAANERPAALDESLLFDAVPSVSGASKYDQRTTDAPASVTVVTSEDIGRHGWRTIDEVLASVRSFLRTDDRTYVGLGVRGFTLPGDYGSRILLLVDGTRMNDAIYDGLPIGTMLPVPLELIDRIEIIRGPASALYGSNALLAVVNVVTRRGRDLAGAELSLEAGTQGTWDARVHGGERLGSGLEYRVGATFFDALGRDFDFSAIALPSDLSGRVHGADAERALSLSSRVAWRQWSLSASFSRRDKTVPTGAWQTVLGSDQTWQIDDNLVVTAELDDHLGSGLDVSARFTYHHYSYEARFHYRVDDGANGFADRRQLDDARADVVRLDVGSNLFLAPTLRLAFGAELDLHLRLVQRSILVEPDGGRAQLMHDERSDGNAGAHVQLEWTPHAAITLNLALRGDYRPSVGGVLSPRLALIVAPSPGTVFKALVGRAFRAPNAFEIAYADGVTVKAPTALSRETITSFELVWEQMFGPRVRTVLDGFFYELDDLVTLAADPSDGLLVYGNRKAMSATGLEAELDLDLDAVHLAGSATFQRVSEESHRLPSSPLFLAKLRIAVPIVDELLVVALEALYTSARLTRSGAETDPIALVNLTLTSKDLLPGLTLRASFDNLLDHRYADPASAEQRLETIPQDGFGFRFRLGYRF